MQDTIERAHPHAELREHAAALAHALERIGQATQAAWSTGDPARALANAVPYMQAFGHVVLAWIWLDMMAVIAINSEACGAGLTSAGTYFYRYELPKIGAWLQVVERGDMTCVETPEDAF
jgi:butyryl-CoA dehydrogenase